ncbi:MAG: 1-acyl-sn-glycerol-3-phosphate acyltransferase [Treponema sp.]|jgi:glycerol-3-phosphate O-acyltransferase|nr:1-acyl-sn-glycerol-3-phosphate acyltransferase [Treponema sp.]
MEALSSFKDIIRQAVAKSRAVARVTEENVFQEGNAEIRPLLDQIVEALLLPGSGIDGMENLHELRKLNREGHSCLLLLEHYSNLDLSIFDYLVRQEAGGTDLADSLVAIAGMKLTEDNPAVAAFASAYTRIVIYPSRSLADLDLEKDKDELLRSASINRAATRALIRAKESGRVVLVFPSGTRYRPWDPSSKRGVREIDSYIRIFDYICPVAINGEVLHVRQGDMLEDSVSKDVVRLTAGPVISASAFRNGIREKAEAAGIEDKKQAVVDAVMNMLEEMHLAGEAERRKLLSKIQPGEQG